MASFCCTGGANWTLGASGHHGGRRDVVGWESRPSGDGIHGCVGHTFGAKGPRVHTPFAGTAIYALLLLVVLWRAVPLVKDGDSSSQKKLFHLFLAIFCIFELPYYMSLARSGYTKPAYVCHLLALWADLCAFSMVIVLWSRALALVKDKNQLYTWVIALDCFALLYTLVVIGLVIVSRSFNEFLSG
jgi:hypothetical protein